MTFKQLVEHFGVHDEGYRALRATLKQLVRDGRLELGPDKSVRKPTDPGKGAVVGTFKRHARGFGFVRPAQAIGRDSDIYISPEDSGDASTGDQVAVRVGRGPQRDSHGQHGRIVRVITRARGQFVGTYLEERGQALVRPDANEFRDPIAVGDPGAKRAQPGDKVAFEMLRYPGGGRGGEGVITEVLGPRGQPGVDTLMVLRAFNIPDTFGPHVLEEARQVAERFDETDLDNRLDLRQVPTITIDPATARDFDDAISLSRDGKGFWNLGVHIADVGHFVRAGSALDTAAHERGTSVYLPDRVVPMLPEVISNGLASLQEGRVRYTLSAFLQFDPEGRRTHSEFARSAILVDKRFTYEQAFDLLKHPEKTTTELAASIQSLLSEMLTLAMMLRERRMRRGALELVMPEVEIELDVDGRVAGAHLAHDDESHQLIEEFMLAANEAVAEHLSERDVAFLRRGHADPEPHKLAQFAEFVQSLGYPMEQPQSRFELQRVLAWAEDRPERHAVHYGLLRSLKQAAYTIEPEGHFALASENYCHFTSPIRRYPDLQVHRQLTALLEHKAPRNDLDELELLAAHCTKLERRAEAAERDLTRIKLLTHLEGRMNEEFHAVVTGVEEFGLFCQLVELPADGLLHVSTLGDDFYYLEPQTHTLIGRRSGRRFRLGDRLIVRIARVDVDRRELNLVPADFPRDRIPPPAPKFRRSPSTTNGTRRGPSTREKPSSVGKKKRISGRKKKKRG